MISILKKNITSRDVAKAAGVSQSLVSMILTNASDKKIKPETREHVIEVARRLNYEVNINARNMKSRRAGAIGLLSSWDENSFVFPPVIKGVQTVCVENGLGVVICTGKAGAYGMKDYINYYLQNRIDGLIYISYVGVGNEGVIEELYKNGIPFVCIIGARDLPGVSCVDVSFTESGSMAVKHLWEQGFRNIAYLQSGDYPDLNYAEKERIDGCKKAAEEYGMTFSLTDLFKDSVEDADRCRAAEELMKSGSCDCIISTSYACFLMLKAAARAGINVPGAIGVISLDNEVYAPYLYPSLTTVDEPLVDIAENAANIIIEKLKDGGACRKLEIAPSLTIRESTCRKACGGMRTSGQ